MNVMASNGTVGSHLRSCKRCKKDNVITGVKCIKCESFFHNSCAKQKGVKILDNDDIVCCETEVNNTNLKNNAFSTLEEGSTTQDIFRILNQICNQLDRQNNEIEKLRKIITSNEHEIEAKFQELKGNQNKIVNIIDNEIGEKINRFLNEKNNLTHTTEHTTNSEKEHNNDDSRQVVNDPKQNEYNPNSNEIQNNAFKLYSSVAKKQKVVTLVVEPKQPNEDKNLNVKNHIKNIINPIDLNYYIGLGKTTKTGGVIINCEEERENQKENILKNIQEKLGGDYIVKEPVKRKPKVKITSISKDDNNEDLINKIAKQNNLSWVEKEGVTIINKMETDKFNFNMIIEVGPNTFNEIRQKDKLKIGYKKCEYREHINIKQCYNCWKYGHYYRDCRSNQTCPFCAGNHTQEYCQSEYYNCSNCTTENLKKNTWHDTTHSVWNKQCHVYKKMIGEQKRRINYEV